MTEAFDPRLVKVSITFEDGVHVYQDLMISARGRLLASAIASQCEVQIFNLNESHKNYILTQGSPYKFPRTLIPLSLEVGRESYGTFEIFNGQMLAGAATQPPDIGITLVSVNNSFLLGAIIASTQPPISSLKTICQQCATRNSLSLDFQATDKQIDNYSYSGSVAGELRNIEKIGGINVYSNNGKMIVLDSNKPRAGTVRLINAANGMVGVPEVTSSGVNVRVMIDNSLQLGGSVQVESEINPAANGVYKIVQMDFDLANRRDPFWYVLKLWNTAYIGGTS